VGQNKHQNYKELLQRLIGIRVAGVMVAGNFGPKSCAGIQYTMWFSLILRTIYIEYKKIWNKKLHAIVKS
jgi:hypothetical protein